MSNLFGNLSTEGLEEAQDRLGGFQPLESGAYTGTIKALYAGKSASSQAQSVTLILDLDNGREYRETFWVSGRSGQNYYPDKNDPKKKHPLAGFTMIDDLCMVTTNKPLSQQTAEDKVMNIYDPEAKKEMPKSVPMLIEPIGQKVTLGIIKQIKNKQAKNSAGDYVDTNETREENETNKVFHHPTNLTVVEARQELPSTFHSSWVEHNRGKTRDTSSKIDQGVKAGRPGANTGAPKAGDSAAKTSSLFG